MYHYDCVTLFDTSMNKNILTSFEGNPTVVQDYKLGPNIIPLGQLSRMDSASTSGSLKMLS